MDRAALAQVDFAHDVVMWDTGSFCKRRNLSSRRGRDLHVCRLEGGPFYFRYSFGRLAALRRFQRADLSNDLVDLSRTVSIFGRREASPDASSP